MKNLFNVCVAFVVLFSACATSEAGVVRSFAHGVFAQKEKVVRAPKTHAHKTKCSNPNCHCKHCKCGDNCQCK